MPVHLVSESKMHAFSKLYLAAYNGLQSVGWGYILVQTLKFLIRNKTTVGVWSSNGSFLLVLQSLAGLEVLHSILGLVRANTFITAAQVLSRLLQAWGIIYSVEEIQNSPTVAVVMIAWGLAEVTRYSFYFANLCGKSPYFLTWCRYTFFMALYPLGVFGEVSNVILALGPIRDRQLYSVALPNAANFSFNYCYANMLVLFVYVPMFPKLFFHMLHQRRKVLGSAKAPHSSLSRPDISKKAS